MPAFRINHSAYIFYPAMSYITRLVAFLSRGGLINPRTVHAGTVVKKVTLGQIFLPEFWFTLVSMIQSMLYNLD